jgi:hypothetical protein
MLLRPDREHVRPRRAPLMRPRLGGALATQESTTVACQASSRSTAASAARFGDTPYRKACRDPLLLPPLAHNSRQGTGLGGVGR